MIELQYGYIKRHLLSISVIKSGVSTPFFPFKGFSEQIHSNIDIQTKSAKFIFMSIYENYIH